MKKAKKKQTSRKVSSASRTAPASANMRFPNRRYLRPINEEKAWLIAIEYCLFHYPTLYTGGKPQRSGRRGASLWIVPIILRNPDANICGIVGELRIDSDSGKVVASTPRAQVVAAGAKLYEERENVVASALVSARKK
jgi:hypothetical protein